MQRVFDILSATIIAAIVVLLIMNASKTATVISSFGNFWTKETTILTGSGYVQ